MKKTISIVLMLVMVLSLSVASFAEDSSAQTAPAPKAQTAAATPVRATDETANAQIEYLFNNFNTFKQAESADAKWSYAVTDLDHNGRLELLAASVQGDGRYTHVMAWEVGTDLASAAPIQVNVPEDESFPDILTDSADTFYNPVSNTWIYMFYDNIVFSADEAYYAKCAVKLADDGLSFQQLAIQHNQAAGGIVGHIHRRGTQRLAGRGHNSRSLAAHKLQVLAVGRRAVQLVGHPHTRIAHHHQLHRGIAQRANPNGSEKGFHIGHQRGHRSGMRTLGLAEGQQHAPKRHFRKRKSIRPKANG